MQDGHSVRAQIDSINCEERHNEFKGFSVADDAHFDEVSFQTLVIEWNR